MKTNSLSIVKIISSARLFCSLSQNILIRYSNTLNTLFYDFTEWKEWLKQVLDGRSRFLILWERRVDFWDFLSLLVWYFLRFIWSTLVVKSGFSILPISTWSLSTFFSAFSNFLVSDFLYSEYLTWLLPWPLYLETNPSWVIPIPV